MDSPIIINCTSPLSFVGTAGVILKCILFFDEIPVRKQNSPRWDVTSGAILIAYVPQKGRYQA